MTFFVVIIMKNQVPDQPEKVFQRGKLAHHFTFFFLGVGHQVIRVRIDPMFGPPSSCVCVCVDARRGPPHFLQIQTCCASECFLEGTATEKEKGRGGFEFNRTPIARCLSRVLAFYLLSVLFCTLPPPPPAPPHTYTASPPPLLPLSVCLLADEFVSLSGFSQTLRHLLPTDTQTQR